MIRQLTSVRGLHLGVGLLTAFAAQTTLAQQADPGFVVSRTVNPRIAYRGVPLEDNPVHVRATTFPARIFHSTLDSALGDPADDAMLGGNTASVGIVVDVTRTLLVTAPNTPLLHGGATPLGMGASVGGAISGATSGFADTITNSVLGAAQTSSSSTGRAP